MIDKLIVVGIPVTFLLIDGFGSWMMRGDGCHLEDWCKGFDAILASATSCAALVYQRIQSAASVSSKSALGQFGYLLVCILALFAVIVIHYQVTRHYKDGNLGRFWRVFWLLGVENLIGFGILAVFLLLIQ